MEPGFIVSPLAWTTSTSRPPFLSIRPISTSPRFMKTDSRVRGNTCVYILCLDFPSGIHTVKETGLYKNAREGIQSRSRTKFDTQSHIWMSFAETKLQ